jgi:hypothetical protein
VVAAPSACGEAGFKVTEVREVGFKVRGGAELEARDQPGNET